MAWVETRDTIVNILEGVALTAHEAANLPRTLKHVEEATEEFTPDTRCFALALTRIALKPENTPDGALPNWFRFEGFVIIWYRIADPTLLFEVIASDFEAIADDLPDTSNWNQPASTIESLWLGSEPIFSSEIAVDDDGVARILIPITGEYRRT